jgi:CheY-like chemotaxis protein
MFHVLVVDDDYHFRRSLVIQLELEGYRVSDVENAVQAFNFFKSCQSQDEFPDIVISDVKMPEIRGQEFVPMLHLRYPRLPVIVISAFDLPQELDGYPFVRKPFKMNTMMQKVSESVSSHR